VNGRTGRNRRAIPSLFRRFTQALTQITLSQVSRLLNTLNNVFVCYNTPWLVKLWAVVPIPCKQRAQRRLHEGKDMHQITQHFFNDIKGKEEKDVT
jgi:hypothetical protein